MGKVKQISQKNIRAFLVIISVLVNFFCYSQDIHFSQYFASPLSLNPALAGQYEGDFRFMTNYKNQWVAVSKNSFKTFAASADAAIYKKKIFAGLSFFNDKAGDAKMGTNAIHLSLASKISLNDDNSLVAGIQTGWAQRSVDINGVTWDSQFDGKIFDNTLPSGETELPANYSYFDISSGVYWKCNVNNNVIVDAGVAAFHLNSPKQSYYGNGDRLHPKLAFHGSSEIKTQNKNYTYVPSFMILTQGATNEFNIGMMVRYNLGMDSKYTGINVSSNIFFGAYYRIKDAAILCFQYEYKNTFALGISYDVNLSKLRTASYFRGGGEISLSYKLFRPQKSMPRI